MHTETQISDFVIRWLNNKPPNRQIDTWTYSCICKGCFNKINEYDMFCVTAERIDKELRDTFLTTEAINSADGIVETPLKIAKNNTAHSSVQEFTRIPSNYKFPKPSIPILIQVEKKKTFKCNVCSKVFEHNKGVQKCLRRHRMKHEEPVCKVCNLRCENHDKLKIHKKVHSGRKGAQSYECYLCNHTPISCIALIKHMRRHTGEKPFNCTLCAKNFSVLETLRLHMRTHNKEESAIYQCDVCQRSFIDKAYMKRHRAKHDVPTCKICNLQFKSMFELNVHKFKHSGIRVPRAYECYLCKYNTMNSQHCRSHMMKHIGDRPFKCNLCTKSFKRKGNLNIHNKREHGNGFLEVYKCDECGKEFRNEWYWNKHKFVHSSPPCEVCNETITSVTQWRNHKELHSGRLLKSRTTLNCKICKYTTTYERLMKTHMFKHSGERPFQCKKCQKKFISFYTLKMHIKKKHGE